MSDKARELDILVIDDNPDHAEFIMDAIKSTNPNHIVHYEADGQAAIDNLHDATRFKPDLIFMDIKMPRLDGISALRLLKSEEKLRCIPVIIVTTSATGLELNEAYRAGASGYIKKPIEYDLLQSKISQAIEYWTSTVELPGQLL